MHSKAQGCSFLRTMLRTRGPVSYHGDHGPHARPPCRARAARPVRPAAARRRLPARDLADLGLDLPRDQVRARQLPALRRHGHALPRRRAGPRGLDALGAPRALAGRTAVAPRARRRRADARRRDGCDGLRRAEHRLGAGRRLHRHRAGDHDARPVAVLARRAGPRRVAGHRGRPGRRGAAHARPGPPGLGRGAGGDRHRLRRLVRRQPAQPAPPAARAGCDGFRQRDGLRRRRAAGDGGAARRVADPRRALAARAAGRRGVGLSRRVRLAGRVQRLHAAARAHLGRSGVELRLRQPGDRAAAGRDARRRNRERVRVGGSGRGARWRGAGGGGATRAPSGAPPLATVSCSGPDRSRRCCSCPAVSSGST